MNTPPPIIRPNRNPSFNSSIVNQERIDNLIVELIKRKKTLNSFVIDQLFEILNKEVFVPIPGIPVVPQPYFPMEIPPPPKPPINWLPTEPPPILRNTGMSSLAHRTQSMNINREAPLIRQQDAPLDYFGVN